MPQNVFLMLRAQKKTLLQERINLPALRRKTHVVPWYTSSNSWSIYVQDPILCCADLYCSDLMAFMGVAMAFITRVFW